MAGSGSNRLRVVLKELGWSYTRLIAELRRRSSIALPKTESMVTLVSRWVNNPQQPDDFYRDLLSRATGRARAELFSDDLLYPFFDGFHETPLLRGLKNVEFYQQIAGNRVPRFPNNRCFLL